MDPATFLAKSQPSSLLAAFTLTTGNLDLH